MREIIYKLNWIFEQPKRLAFFIARSTTSADSLTELGFLAAVLPPGFKWMHHTESTPWNDVQLGEPA